MELNSSNFAVVTCANCGLEFCLPKALQERREEDHATFYCPNGHAQCYTQPKGDSREVKRLKGRIAELEAQVAQLREKHYDPSYVAFLQDHPDGYVREGAAADGVPSGG